MNTILSADDLNDFIAPGVACVKPVEITKSRETAVIEIGPDGAAVETREDGTKDPLKQAQISLTDCLACSGCVTSSEEFLLALQSPKEVLKALEDHEKVFAVSVSHQSRVSLAQAYQMPVDELDNKLKSFFVDTLGFQYYVGTEIGRVISLESSAIEMFGTDQQQTKTGKGPTISSVCPGWTVYAEKTHPEVLPYLSHVRSPQQITGRLLKTLISKERGITPENIYHLSIMPCFDKKLEASREEFSLDGAHEVDTVITAREVVQMVSEVTGGDLAQILTKSTTELAVPQSWPAQNQWKSNAGSSSGGYLAYILERAVALNPTAQLVEIPGKNSDWIEYRLVDSQTQDVLFRGAQIYGFRNIQNLVRKLKPSKFGRKVVKRPARARTENAAGSAPQVALSEPTELNYIELMACPGGCINGGGQIGAPESVPAKIWTEQLNQVYETIQQVVVSGDLAASFMNDIGLPADDKLVFSEHKPLERTSVLPEALTVGTQW